MSRTILVVFMLSASTGLNHRTALSQEGFSIAGFTISVPKIYEFNIEWSTMGGRQMWSDELYRSGWRMQRNAFTKHYRLLDAQDVRKAWGPEEHCRNALERLIEEDSIPPTSGRVVILLHGLGRSHKTMEPMADYLSEQSEYTVLNLTYASTRESVDQHAMGLAKLIDELPEVTEINLVAHSLGNLVTRRYLGLHNEQGLAAPVDPRIRRMVMLGPPNQGAFFARMLKNNGIFRVVLGKSGYQLSTDWEDLNSRLATPAFEFGIIAGNRGRNPILPGEDDLVVGVRETKLAGARDFQVLPVYHTRMMEQPRVLEMTLRFLQEGHFISGRQRQPLPAQAPASER